jgi:hypothetical protein
LVTAVIGSAVVPTLIAQQWFQPAFKLAEQEDGNAGGNRGRRDPAAD